MDKLSKWFFIIVFGIPWGLAILSIIFLSVSAAFDMLNPFDRDYRLTGTEVNIEILQDGDINVHEDINYFFKGCYREVFRELDMFYPDKELFNLEGIDEPYIDRASASCIPSCTVDDRGYEIAGNYGQICDRDAELFVDYTIKKGIVQGSDTAEFHYKIWGEKWERSVKSITGTITLPQGINKDQVQVYFNPKGIVKGYEIKNNIITFNTRKFNNFLEVRLLLPKSAFSDKGEFLENAQLKKADIIMIQDAYENKYNAIYAISLFFYVTVLFLLLYVPYHLFNKYGKEPDIHYNARFEREPVPDIKPYVVNSLCIGKTGDTDPNAITATLLDLIRRKHIRMEASNSKKSTMTLFFQKNKKDRLSDPEQELFDYFHSLAKDDELKWDDLLAKLKTVKESKRYLAFALRFENAVDDDYKLKEYFDNKGNTYFKTFCALMMSASFILFWVFAFVNDDGLYPIASNLSLIFILSTVSCLAGLFIPAKVFGRFSPKGYEIYRKSMNYRRFMTDLTQLKKYPPASLIIWEEQLVYAALFGAAEKVIKQMKLSVKEDMVASSNIYPLYHVNTFRAFSRPYSLASSTVARANSSSGSGFSGGGFSGGGSVGGGFGGGGGGAR
ncbi:MAG: DUF2207 domain-containing protein [Nanoarchaeota archaeon]|nr:DUF2207 domain-containing protein [Nanoarchaeota archaeon]